VRAKCLHVVQNQVKQTEVRAAHVQFEMLPKNRHVGTLRARENTTTCRHVRAHFGI